MNIRLRKNRDGTEVWRLEVYVSGMRRVRTVDANPRARDKGRKQAEEEWLRLRDAVRVETDNFVVPSSQRTDAYLQEWLEDRRPYLKPKTFTGYQSVLRRHVVPTLGPIPIRDLSPAVVQKLWSRIGQTGKARTADLARTVLHKALQDAYRLGRVSQNVVDRTQVPPIKARRKIVPFTVAQVAALVRAAPPRWRPLLALTAASGLRRGEVCGFQWGDYDERTGLLTIQRSIVENGSEPLVQDTTKTKAGERRVLLTTRGRRSLEDQRMVWTELQRQAGDGWVSQDWMFTTRTGRPLHPRNVVRAYEHARDKAGLPKQSFHGLRHYAVSVELSAGVPLELVAKRIGHANRALTADVYGHLLPEKHIEIVTMIDGWLDAQS